MAKIKATLTPRDFGFVKAVTDPSAPDSLLVARLFGLADGFTVGKSPDGQEFTGLAGQFQVQTVDPKTGEITGSTVAGRLFFPSGIGNDVMAKVTELTKSETKHVDNVRFAYNIFGRKAGNPAGYSWEFESILPEETVSPLGEFVAQVAALPRTVEALQIADQSKTIDHSETIHDHDVGKLEHHDGKRKK